MVVPVVAKILSTHSYLQILQLFKVFDSISNILSAFVFDIVEIKVQRKYLELLQSFHE